MRNWGHYDPKPDTICVEIGCGRQAVEQDSFEDELCEMHLYDAYETDKADWQTKYAKENR